MLKNDRYRAQLPLFDGVAVDANRDGTRAVTPGSRGEARLQTLWLCVYFPQLCLEALGSPAVCPAAVLAAGDGVSTILACNDRAVQAGVIPGISLNAALALCPELDIRERREAAEATLLQTRANRALAYTPVVSIVATGALLLEIGASLRLFGGFGALRERLAADSELCGQHALFGTAPTARAALWLARSGQERDCTAQHELPGILGRLPLACLDWPVTLQHQFLQMGVRTVGDCMRLPRDGFARRAGPARLRELDQAFGRCPELLSHYHAPESFHSSFELAAETLLAGEIGDALQVLLGRLSVLLEQQQAGVQRLSVQLAHCGQAATVLEIVLRQPCATVDYFLELLYLRLDRQSLPAAVTEVFLQATPVPIDQHVTKDLLGGIGIPTAVSSQVNSHARAIRLVERLAARLGQHCVYGLRQVAEHRPERAWHVAEAFATDFPQGLAGSMMSRIRPLWLFARPWRLTTCDGLPEYRGRLVFSSDAERIESGWWDGNDIRRDYYTVTGEQGCRYWIYQDCNDSGWYLHGLLG